MKCLLGSQELLDVVEEGYDEPKNTEADVLLDEEQKEALQKKCEKKTRGG